MDLEFIDIKNEIEEIAYEDKLFKTSYHISPFRPEMFGSLIYATIFYICNKYDIELVMHGEANMMPMYSLYCNRFICYDTNKMYQDNKASFNKNREVLIEHIQRKFDSLLENKNIKFGSRFGVKPVYDSNKMLGSILDIVGKKSGQSKQEIMSDITYNDVKSFILNILKTRKILLNKKSQECLEKIKNKTDGRLWFCSHNKSKFKDFENYIYHRIPEMVIKDSLWSQRQNIQDIILDTDSNSFLSTQILASQQQDIRFIASGGAATLFQVIPHIRTVHLTIWDYYTLDYDDIKTNCLAQQNISHKIFHVGGILNNSLRIPFKNRNSAEIDFLDIPTYAKKMSVYDTNILNYIGHVGDCLVEQKETELLEILNRL